MKDDQFYQMQKISMARLMEDTSMHELAVSWSVRSDRKTFAEMYCNFSNTDLRSRITSIKCPAFVLLEAGFVNNKAVIDEQFINLKTVKLAYANKGLHFIMYDDKEWYLNQISSFLNGK